MTTPYIWTIAGSDSSGGAGIQADLKTFHDFGVLGGSVITTITAQNSSGVQASHYLTAEVLQQQIDALSADLPPKVIKLGMQGELTPVARFLENYSGTVICDPIIKTTCGHVALTQLENFIQLIFPHVDLLTPNIFEAEQLLQTSIQNYTDIENAAKILIKMGVKRVYLKGGHFHEAEFSQDYYTDGELSLWLSHVKIPTVHTHGTGCTLSSAIAACLALDYSLLDALVIARMYVQQGIRCAIPYGLGVGAVAHNGFPKAGIDLPYLSHQPIYFKPKPFATCGAKKIGLYPIVSSSQWVLFVAKAGISTVQLRIKDKSELEVEAEIIAAIQIAQQFQCRLFINDYWQLAIKHGAYGVHLGQEDLQTANLLAIQAAGLRLGISTHCFYEVARAHALNPSYIACGPIFATTSKIMPFAPQGLAALTYWRNLLDYPIVAIGGIQQNNIAAVNAIGADGIALISAISTAKNPAAVIAQLLLHFQ